MRQQPSLHATGDRLRKRCPALAASWQFIKTVDPIRLIAPQRAHLTSRVVTGSAVPSITAHSTESQTWARTPSALS